MPQETDAREIGVVLAEFASSVGEQQSSQQILERLGDYCTELLPVTGVGVLLVDGKGGLEVATANTEQGQIVERLEMQLLEGPCTDAIATGEQLVVPDLSKMTDEYPRFAPAALEAGVQSIHALPMTLRTQTVGALDIIAGDVTDLTAVQIATAQMLADVTISYVANSRAFDQANRTAQQLQQALDSRILIEQAKGVLSERHGITVTDAFDRLRRHSRNNGLKLHGVAGSVVRGELDL